MTDLISRQAAIGILEVGKEILDRVLSDTDVVGHEREKYLWGLGLIEAYINDMKELLPAQPEPCEDAVSRRRLLSDLKELTAAWGKYPVMEEQIKGVETAIGYVETIPSAQPEIIHCRDCRHHGTAICRIWSRYGTINTPGYGFCYRAERKEQDEGD